MGNILSVLGKRRGHRAGQAQRMKHIHKRWHNTQYIAIYFFNLSDLLIGLILHSQDLIPSFVEYLILIGQLPFSIHYFCSRQLLSVRVCFAIYCLHMWPPVQLFPTGWHKDSRLFSIFLPSWHFATTSFSTNNCGVADVLLWWLVLAMRPCDHELCHILYKYFFTYFHTVFLRHYGGWRQSKDLLSRMEKYF